MSSGHQEEWIEAIKKPRSVLLVEDSQDDCKLILDRSKDWNIEWFVAHSYDEALHQFETQNGRRFKLVMLDLNLNSEQDGITLFRWIKQKWPDMPVMVLTGDLTDRSIRSVLSVGVAVFAAKPDCFDRAYFAQLFPALGIPKKVPEADLAISNGLA